MKRILTDIALAILLVLGAVFAVIGLTGFYALLFALAFVLFIIRAVQGKGVEP